MRKDMGPKRDNDILTVLPHAAFKLRVQTQCASQAWAQMQISWSFRPLSPTHQQQPFFRTLVGATQKVGITSTSSCILEPPVLCLLPPAVPTPSCPNAIPPKDPLPLKIIRRATAQQPTANGTQLRPRSRAPPKSAFGESAFWVRGT